MWKRLLDLKFYEYAEDVSAAWFATRIKRVGNSRKSMFQEQLGHIGGGSQTLVDALVAAIEAKGGAIHLGTPVMEVVSDGGTVKGIRSQKGMETFDHVISTAPTPLVSRMIPGLTDAEKAAYDAIDNIGCVCLVMKLKKPVTEHFWVNVIDDEMEIPGLIEFSNLRGMLDHVVYVPYYMPVTHPKFVKPDAFFADEAFGYVKRINSAISEDDLIGYHVGRLKHAQPICGPGFSRRIPEIQTSIDGLQVADTCFYYPEDRGISESVRVAKEMVAKI